MMKLLALVLVVGAALAAPACSSVSAEESEANARAGRASDRAVRAESMYNESLRK